MQGRGKVLGEEQVGPKKDIESLPFLQNKPDSAESLILINNFSSKTQSSLNSIRKLVISLIWRLVQDLELLAVQSRTSKVGERHVLLSLAALELLSYLVGHTGETWIGDSRSKKGRGREGQIRVYTQQVATSVHRTHIRKVTVKHLQ